MSKLFSSNKALFVLRLFVLSFFLCLPKIEPIAAQSLARYHYEHKETSSLFVLTHSSYENKAVKKAGLHLIDVDLPLKDSLFFTFSCPFSSTKDHTNFFADLFIPKLKARGPPLYS